MPSSNKPKKPQAKSPPFPVRLFWAAAAIILLVPALVVFALHIPAVQQSLIISIVNRIENATYYKVEIQSYKWWPFSRLYVEKLRVESGGKTILDCGEVRLSYGFRASFPFINPEEIYLGKPYLQVERGDDGKWLLPGSSGGGRGQGGEGGGAGSMLLNMALPTLHVVSGTIEGRQRGNIVLSIKDATGIIHLKRVSGPEGVSIGVDLDNLRAQKDIYGIGGKVNCRVEFKDNGQSYELSGQFQFPGAKMNLGRLEIEIAKNIEVIEADARVDVL